MAAPRYTDCSCPSCHTLFTHVPFEVDEDGGYAVLEVAPCADPRCGKLLCASCEQFHCDDCGGRFCLSHLSVVDGPNLCSACAAVSVRCPECLSDDVRIERFDGGICSETGYHDSGEEYVCRDCGHSGPIEDLIKEITHSEPVVSKCSVASEQGTAVQVSHEEVA